MKKRIFSMNFIKLLIVMMFLVVQSSCSKEEERETCGCKSDVTKTIPGSLNLIGQIAYKIPLDPDDNYYNDKFWISYVEPNCGNCRHFMIVCNEEMLTDFQDLRYPPYESIQIRFSGDLKLVCDKIFAPGDYTYNHIILTKIEKL